MLKPTSRPSMNMPVTRKTAETPSTSGQGSFVGALRPESRQHSYFNSHSTVRDEIWGTLWHKLRGEWKIVLREMGFPLKINKEKVRV